MLLPLQLADKSLVALQVQAARELQQQKEQLLQQQEKDKFDMFKSLMDGFLAERAQADSEKKQLQTLLAQASKVSVLFTCYDLTYLPSA